MIDPITKSILAKSRDQWTFAETEWMRIEARNQAKLNRQHPNPVMERMIAEEAASSLPQFQQPERSREEEILDQLQQEIDRRTRPSILDGDQ